MYADSTNTALCRCSLWFVFLSSSVQITFDGCPEIHMHHPSHLRMKPQPLENNLTHYRANYHTRKRKERRRKRIKIHNAETITRKIFTDPNCMFCFCVSMQLHISNTEHVLCACNRLQVTRINF